MSQGGGIANNLNSVSEISATAPLNASSPIGDVNLSLTVPLVGLYGGTGIANTGLTINLGGGSTGLVLTSDSSGNATWAASAGAVLSVSGTANQIAASASIGAVTLSLVGPYTPASYTAYGVICGGTSSTGSLQAVSPGASGTVLVSAGSSSLPVWTTIAEGYSAATITVSPTAMSLIVPVAPPLTIFAFVASAVYTVGDEVFLGSVFWVIVIVFPLMLVMVLVLL